MNEQRLQEIVDELDAELAGMGFALVLTFVLVLGIYLWVRR